MHERGHIASRNVQFKRDLELESGKAKEGAPAEFGTIAQLQHSAGNKTVMQLLGVQAALQRRSGSPEAQGAEQENRTGMPDNLKSGLENLSGMDLSDVKVHYNSDKPAELGALAYAQGTDIHIGPGQEEHLPHEGWHVVQQKQGRVRPTLMEGGAAINDDAALEAEADRMGAQALQMKSASGGGRTHQKKAESAEAQTLQKKVVQRQQTEVYVKNVKGSYTDDEGTHEIDYPEATHIATTKSHPRGEVNYDSEVKKMLKKNRVVPREIADDQITVTYVQYGKKK